MKQPGYAGLFAFQADAACRISDTARAACAPVPEQERRLEFEASGAPAREPDPVRGMSRLADHERKDWTMKKHYTRVRVCSFLFAVLTSLLLLEGTVVGIQAGSGASAGLAAPTMAMEAVTVRYSALA